MQEECGFGAYSVAEIPHFRLQMKDGTKIGLKLWIPVDLGKATDSFLHVIKECEFVPPKQLYTSKTEIADPERSFPAILEYLPYCKDHWSGPRDYSRLAWFASHGFVCVRGDMRGSGTSSGLLLDEYLPEEQSDCIEIINWIATQPWSNGRVGMYGKSWGGFNGLQIAYEQPEALKAVVSAYSLDDRFADDIHYMGGCVIGNGMLSWAAQMFLWQARPPHPTFYSSTDEWKAEWKARLESSSKSWLEAWLSHQTRHDPYWCHGSVIEDIDRIKCPILVVGSFADGYTNAALRMGATLNLESRTVIGPWSHDWPDTAAPGPRIDWLNLCLNWWQYHLKDRKKANEDVSQWPRLRMFIQQSCPPANFHDSLTGSWHKIEDWDSLYENYRKGIPSKELLNLHISSGGKLCFGSGESDLDTVALESHALQGDAGGEWLSWGGKDLPSDQQRANSHSYCWESEPLDADFVIAGFTTVTLTLEAKKDAKYALAVRLCDILPNGQANRITFGLKNLCQYPEKFVPKDQEIRVAIELNAAGYVVPKGNRLSLVVSPSYFPLMYTTPEKEGLVLYPGKTKILIQTLSREFLAGNRTDFKPPLPLAKIPHEVKREGKINEVSNYSDNENGFYTCASTADSGDIYYPHLGVVYSETSNEAYKVNKEGNKGQVVSKRFVGLEFPAQNLKTSVDTYCTMEDNKDAFLLKEQLKVRLNGDVFYENEWNQSVPREYV